MSAIQQGTPAPTGRSNWRKLSPDEYSIVWFCATKEEAEAAKAILDERHKPPTLSAHSETTFDYGTIKGDHTSHNAVVVRPTASGKANIVHAASHVKQNFPNLYWAFFVGIAGGLPDLAYKDDPANSIERGDVVIGCAKYNFPAVIQHDYAEVRGANNHRTKHVADKTAGHLQSLFDHWFADFEEDYENGETTRAQQILESLTKKSPKFAAPAEQEDVLFQSSQEHQGPEGDCSMCLERFQHYRRRSKTRVGETYPIKLHCGLVLTGDGLLKSAEVRGALKSRYNTALCVEMESAVLMDNWHPLIIRGISDYADSHYGWKWVYYAAAAAAAVAKDMIIGMQQNYPHLASE